MEHFLGMKREIWFRLCTVIVSIVLYMLFSWDVMLILGCVLLIFAWASWWGRKESRKNSLWRIRFGENSIDLIDHADAVIKSAEYRYVRRAEVRNLRLVMNRGGRGSMEVPQHCRLIMIYFDGTYCFEDLKARQYYLIRGGDDAYYVCGDIFFHHGCITLAYDEAAWNYLQLQID